MLQYQTIIEQTLMNKTMTERYETIPERLFSVHPKRLYEEMPQILNDCERIQKAVLKEILELAQSSAYAQEHNLVGVANWETWKEKACISNYDDYKLYIKSALQGSENQLYSGETLLYIATTGSTGNVKYFLESKAGDAAKQLVMAIRGMYMSELLPVTLDMEAKNLTISNYAPVGDSRDGKLIVRASGQTARNMRKKTGVMNLLPIEFWESTGLSADTRDYMMAVYALAEVRLSKIFCNNLIHFGRLLDRIQAQGQQMIEDIRYGVFSISLPNAVKERLKPTFKANPQRADELQRIYNKKQCLIVDANSIASIWPSLSMVSCWLSAAVGRDAREVLRRLPKGIECFDLGYGASEGKLNIPVKLADAAGVAASFSCFYEFLPLDGGAPLSLWEVEDGVYYELLITTYSGLYRYNMQDVIKIEGFTGNTPNLLFCGKSSDVIWKNGRKYYSYQFMELLYQLEQQYKIEFDLVQLYQEEENLFYLLESKQEINFVQVKKTLDDWTTSRWALAARVSM